MKPAKKISKYLSSELKQLGFLYEVSLEDHPYCSTAGCKGKHLERKVKIWRPEKPNHSWSFQRVDDDHILSRLSELHYPSWL